MRNFILSPPQESIVRNSDKGSGGIKRREQA
jgi:hypothetical protein